MKLTSREVDPWLEPLKKAVSDSIQNIDRLGLNAGQVPEDQLKCLISLSAALTELQKVEIFELQKAIE